MGGDAILCQTSTDQLRNLTKVKLRPAFHKTSFSPNCLMLSLTDIKETMRAILFIFKRTYFALIKNSSILSINSFILFISELSSGILSASNNFITNCKDAIAKKS